MTQDRAIYNECMEFGHQLQYIRYGLVKCINCLEIFDIETDDVDCDSIEWEVYDDLH